ncbi:MAG: septation protein IspZ [Rhizomicrobium sp.]|jgi:intracellular septation protein A
MHFLRAIKPIFRDLLSTILFVSLFWLTNNIFWATAFGIAFGIGQTLWMRTTGRSVGPLQWVSLVLITVFGTTTIITHDPHFIMVKPTLVWLAVGAVMLRRDWMAPYLPPIVTENLDDRLIARAGYAWAALMFVLAALNLLVAFTMTAKFWSVYALAAPAAAQLALITAQYFMFRRHVIDRIRARAEAQIA